MVDIVTYSLCAHATEAITLTDALTSHRRHDLPHHANPGWKGYFTQWSQMRPGAKNDSKQSPQFPYENQHFPGLDQHINPLGPGTGAVSTLP